MHEKDKDNVLESEWEEELNGCEEHQTHFDSDCRIMAHK